MIEREMAKRTVVGRAGSLLEAVEQKAAYLISTVVEEQHSGQELSPLGDGTWVGLAIHGRSRHSLAIREDENGFAAGTEDVDSFNVDLGKFRRSGSTEKP